MSGSKRKTAQPPFARLVVADELGLLKAFEVPAGPAWDAGNIVHKWGTPDKGQAVVALAAPDLTKSDIPIVACTRVTGAVDILHSHTGSMLCTLAPPTPPPSSSGAATQALGSSAASTCKTLAFTHHSSGSSSLQLVSCTGSGLLRLHRLASNAAASTSAPSIAHAAGGHGSWELASSFQTAAKVACMAVHGAGEQVAVGGDGCQLQVWSLSQGSEVFHAKGAKPNMVGNVDLPHLTALTWIPGEGSQLVLAGTVKHKLWLYDLRAGKRPQMDLAWGEARITTLAAQHDGSRVWVGNGTGHVEALDIRARKIQGALKGTVGSVTGMAIHPDPSQPLIATVGLDRYLRVYSTSTRAMQCKGYAKQQLTGVAWVLPPPVPEEAAAAQGDEPVGGPDPQCQATGREPADSGDQRAGKKAKAAGAGQGAVVKKHKKPKAP